MLNAPRDEANRPPRVFLLSDSCYGTGREKPAQEEVVVSDCIDCGKTRGLKQTVSLPIHALSGESGIIGNVSLCFACITRRELFCEVHRKVKMCFSDLDKKDGWGKVEILGTCPDCAFSELKGMDDERRHYLAERFWSKDPATADAHARNGVTGPKDVFLDGDDVVVFALLCIAQMYATTPEQVL